MSKFGKKKKSQFEVSFYLLMARSALCINTFAGTDMVQYSYEIDT